MASPLPPAHLLANEMNLSELAALQAHVASLIKGLLPPPPPPLLTKAELRAQVIEMEFRPEYMASWKKVVIKENLVENVFGILEDCYSSLRSKSSNVGGWQAARALGGRDTLAWQKFKLRVIQYLASMKYFTTEDGGFDSFEDTAGGCDEITWDAAIYLLENPAWTPEN